MKQMQKLGIMLDCSRDAVYKLSTLKAYIDLMEKMGYTTLQLYTEDTYTIDEPHFGYLRGRYTEAELRELDGYAAAHGIELVPCIQALAHLSGYLRWNPEVVDCNDILLAGEEQTYDLIDKMFAACARCFTSRRINIGMDEAHMVGLGKYLDRHGYEDRFAILNRHLSRVVELAGKYGFRPMMWSDMFFRLACGGEYYCDGDIRLAQEVIDLVPRDLQLIYWDYYSTGKDRYDHMIAAHKQFRNDIVFAGGAWSWTGFAPHNDFSTAANEAALRACREQGVGEILITNWKDDGAECSLFATLPCMFFTAKMAGGEFDRETLQAQFREFFGVDYSVFQALEQAELCDTLDITNPCKYMLYSDPLVGFMDWTVDPEMAVRFRRGKEALASVSSPEYGYLFDTLTALMQVLEKKYTLGYALRKAYQAGDRGTLAALEQTCTALAGDIRALYGAFRIQWMRECKPYGFEKHTVRLGGLALRMEECALRIREYLTGQAQTIPELEEQLLPLIKDLPAGRAVAHTFWYDVAAVKPMM